MFDSLTESFTFMVMAWAVSISSEITATVKNSEAYWANTQIEEKVSACLNVTRMRQALFLL